MRQYEKADPTIDGLMMRRYLALNEDFTRGKREVTPPPSAPYEFTPEMIESYKRYQNELNSAAAGGENHGAVDSEPSNNSASSKDISVDPEGVNNSVSSGSYFDDSIISVSSNNESRGVMGPTQNLMLVFSGGADLHKTASSIESDSDLSYSENSRDPHQEKKPPKRRNAVDSRPRSKKKFKKL